jgi:glutathione S-transferase
VTLALYGHPFSSYTWKTQIALYAEDIAHEFRIVDGDHPDHAAVVQSAGPAGKFPVLKDGDALLFETTAIIEHLALYHACDGDLIPAQPAAALKARQLDRVFDNYVMGNMQVVVDEHLRDRGHPDPMRIAEARARLERTYAWLENWLSSYSVGERITLVECAAAPSLFYADWVHPIEGYPRLQAWRAHLLGLPAVARCVEDARPYRAWFPLGAPDRD